MAVASIEFDARVGSGPKYICWKTNPLQDSLFFFPVSVIFFFISCKIFFFFFRTFGIHLAIFIETLFHRKTWSWNVGKVLEILTEASQLFFFRVYHSRQYIDLSWFPSPEHIGILRFPVPNFPAKFSYQPTPPPPLPSSLLPPINRAANFFVMIFSGNPSSRAANSWRIRTALTAFWCNKISVTRWLIKWNSIRGIPSATI